MAAYLDGVPLSGIIRIRDLMFTVKDPFRLDQGDISFDAPDKKGEHVTVDAQYVGKMLADIVKDQDLSRYIL